MVKKLFKKSIACIIAVLMVVTSLPLTAMTAMAAEESYTFSAPARKGIIASDTTRYSSGSYNIVNDQEDANFSIGYWAFDITGIGMKDATVKTATFSVNATSNPLQDCQGLTFYFVGNTKADGLSNGNNTVSSVMGVTGEHITKARSYYALTEVARFDKSSISNGTTMSFSIAEAINSSLAKGLDYVTIMVMQSAAGQQAGANDWSDVKVSENASISSCKLDVPETTVDPGLTGLRYAITQYEEKMAKIGSDVTVYTNMTPAYQAYIKAVRYADAYEFGGNQTAYNQLDSVKNELVTATANMKAWTDKITGTYGSDSSNCKVPTFSNTSANDMKKYPEFYGNILYTESCTSGNNGQTNGETSGAAVLWTEKTNMQQQIYYPNTVLLYDGSTNKGTIPVVLMGKKSTSSVRSFTTVYPTVAGAGNSYTSTMPSNNSEFVSLAKVKSNSDYDWKGKDGNNTLDWDYGRSDGNTYVGSEANNPNNRDAQGLGHSWAFGYRYYWNAYATSFQITDDIKFNNKGYKELGLYWVWYGSSKENDGSVGASIDNTLCGYAQATHKIYVLNYKMLTDALKKNSDLTRLNDVANYTEGGLQSVLEAYDAATTFDVAGTTLSNVEAKGNAITAAVNGIQSTPTADSDAGDYAALKIQIQKAKRVYDNGNADNANYTADSWAPFATAYQNAVKYYSDLEAKAIVTADAQQYIAPLDEAQKNLVLNREVVDTTTLQYAIDNADALILNSKYFKSGTVNVSALQSMVDAAKIAIWHSVENYGLDSEKIIKTTANQNIVDQHLAAIVAEVAKAQIDTNSIVSTYGRSMEKAITDGEALASKKDEYANYSAVATAINNAKSFKADLPTINARVEGQVANIVNQYTSYTDAIGYAIATLRPSFRLTTNGTIANPGHTEVTEIRSQARPNQFRFFFKYTTDIVYFKTERDAATWKLPTCYWESWNNQTGNNFDTVLDSINLNAMEVPTAELTSGSAAGTSNFGTYGLSAAQIAEHPGNLSITNNNVGFTLNNFKVKTATGQAPGVDASGTNITDLNYDYTDLLGTTQGSQPRAGGVYALNGTTVINCDGNISVPATTGAPTAANKTSVKSMKLDLAGAGTEVGVLYFWRYANTLVQNWSGYAFDKQPVRLRVGVVDLCTLFDLIDSVETDEFTATANNYTTTSWNALQKAISNAKADMDSDAMTYEEIVNECDARYDALIAAKAALVSPASNAKLKAAVAAAKDVYANDQSKVDPATWDAFQAAYETALAKYQGVYSDTGVRDYAKSEQATIDAFATALTEAQNALAYQVDFTPIDEAVATLLNSIATKTYTKSSVEELINAVNDLTYYNMPLSERATHYTSDTSFVAAVNAELSAIPALANKLVKGNIDADALNAAKALGKASLSDPDAYNQEEINQNLNALSAFVDVNVFGKTISCIKYDTQSDLDADVAAALSSISIQKYVVTVNDVQYGVYDYGTEITIPSNDGVVDWYYASASTTSTTANKYFSTGEKITFIVKGDTEITTTKADQSNNQVKITYVNSANSKIVSVDYVTAGSTVVLDSSLAPGLVYYTFTGFKVGNSLLNAGESFTADEDTQVVLAYEQNSSDYYVYVADLNYGYAEYNFEVSGLKYNDEISFKKGTAANDYTDGYYDADANYYVNGEMQSAGADTGRYQEADVYAWVQVGAENLDAWKDATNSSDENVKVLSRADSAVFSQYAKANTLGKVVAYGTDYTFRIHENVVLLPLDKETYDIAVAQGVVSEPGDSNGAKVTTNKNLMIAEGVKFSMVSTFTLPDDCEMVETGILFVANKNSSVTPSATLTLGTAGTNGVMRIKSTAHTAGNQYVISINSSSLAGKKVGDVGMKWIAYMNYKDASGNTITVYSEEATPTNTEADF